MGILGGGLTWRVFSVFILENTLYSLVYLAMIMVDPEACSYNAPCTVHEIPKLIQVIAK